MLSYVIALALAAALAWWSWHGRLDAGRARAAALARAVGLAALLLLLLDPGIATRRVSTRPLVLVDHSVSMYATGAHAADADRLAASLGDTTSFGELAAGEPGGRTVLFELLAGALASGRPVTVVTDGEIADAGAIPADLLGQATVRLVARAVGADIALADIHAPLRLTAGDTLTLEVDAVRTAGAPDTVAVAVHDSNTVLAHGVLRFAGLNRGRVVLTAALPHEMQGERWLRIERVGVPDAEPGDDVRWWKVTVMPTPGVVVIAESPDWDARALYRTLKDVVEVPIRGYTQLLRGQWRRMDDLHLVSAAEVAAAARSADLLAVRGNPQAWQLLGRARLLWPVADQPGDWYLGAGGASPVHGAFAGVEPDSLPPASAVHALTPDSSHVWVGAVARLSRRGTPVPVITGREDRSGRTVTVAADALFRWPFRGGVPEQVWRTMLANAAAWLLATPAGDSMRARPVTPVTQRGRPVRFRWNGNGPPVALAIELRGPDRIRSDSLRFDGEGNAELALAVGHYHYTLAGGGSGSFAVEPYSDELVPAPVTVREHAGAGMRSSPRRSLREILGLFGIVIAGLGAEWIMRRRMGLR